jgi:toxin FitB
VYLLDTNVIGELRKRERASPGVLALVQCLVEEQAQVYLSVVTLGELRRGVDLIRHRGDLDQAAALEEWLGLIFEEYADRILDFGRDEALLWGHLRVPHHENAIDKQIAATALINDLTLVTRNARDFAATGARLIDPFT